MAKIWFLGANKPLTKSYALNAKNEITQSAYPIVGKFKSHATQCDDLKTFFNELKTHAAKGHCLIKGTLHRELEWANRRQATKTLDKTEWVCLDLDAAPFASPEDLMGKHPALKGVSYVVQYSASHGLGKPGLRAHIFFLLDAAYNATYLKSWLMEMNLDGKLFGGAVRKALTINDAGTSLHWPIDITCCQNDKLLYIAPPTIGKDVPYKAPVPAIQLITKKLACLPVSRIALQKIDTWKTEGRAVLNALRKQAGLPNLRATKIVKTFEVQGSPGELTITGVREDNEFIRLNLNGGDSWAYWHPKNDFEFIHSFKGEPSLLTKEACPTYYQDNVAEARHEATQPTEQGEVILGVCDKRSALLWKVSWNPTTTNLQLYPAKGDKQLVDWLLQHGKVPGDFVPQWRFEFNPANPTIMDVENQYLNTYVPSKYHQQKITKVTSIDACPTIKKVLMSVAGGSEWNEITEHFMNWLAVLFQHKIKIGTTWLFSGTEGCLAGDTELIFRRGNRNAGRVYDIKTAYEKWSGKWEHGHCWDQSITTYTHSVRDDFTIGYHEIYKIVESGVRQLYILQTSDGDTIRTTGEHPFMRPDGSMTKLLSLKQGDVILKRGAKNQHALFVKGRSKQRKTIHSIQHHPYAWQHIIAGKNYKRSHKARLVYEAAMNNLSLEEFVHILRHDWKSAMMLQYLDPSIIVHHRDEDCTNDNLDNLVTVDKLDHDHHHAKTVGLGSVLCCEAQVVSITKDREEMTYDITMKAPYQNYVANGFCVSNTGKNLLSNHIMRPLIGNQYVKEVLITGLEDQFNGWLEHTLLCFVNEIQVSSSQHRKIVSGKLRNWITDSPLDIRPMGQTRYDADNFCNFVMNSNERDAVDINNADRRYNFGTYQEKKLVITNHEVEVLIPKELPTFFNYLMSRQASIPEARRILESATRHETILANRNSVDMLADALIDGDIAPFLEALPDIRHITSISGNDSARAVAFHTIMTRELQTLVSSKADKNNVHRVESKLTRDELFILFDHCVGNMPSSPNKFTRLLKHKRITTVKMRTETGLGYGMHITWVASEEFCEEYRPEKQKLRRVK